MWMTDVELVFAVIINGCVRDSAAIATMQIGIQARGTHPRKTNKLNVGAADIE